MELFTIDSVRSDRIGAAYTDCLAFLTRGDGDLMAHLSIPIAGTDEGIASRLELDVAPCERAEFSDARDRDVGGAIRYQRYPHRLVHGRAASRCTGSRGVR